MSRELDNFRAALGWAIDQKLPDALRMTRGLSRWWVRRASLNEARQWFNRLLDAIPCDRATRDRARGLSAAGNLPLHQGDHDEAGRLHPESPALNPGPADCRGSADPE